MKLLEWVKKLGGKKTVTQNKKSKILAYIPASRICSDSQCFKTEAHVTAALKRQPSRQQTVCISESSSIRSATAQRSGYW